MANGALGSSPAGANRLVILDINGRPAPGAKVYFYASGTSTPLAVYSNTTLTTPRTNPVEADASGVVPPCYLSAAAYRVLITDADGATIYPATDNIYDFGQLYGLSQNSNGDASITRDLSVGRDLAVTRNATVGGTLAVAGNTTLSGTLGVTGAVTLSSTLAVTGAVSGAGFSGGSNPLTVSGSGASLSITNTGSQNTAGSGAVTYLSSTASGCSLRMASSNRICLDQLYDATPTWQNRLICHSSTNGGRLELSFPESSTPQGVRVVYTAAAPNGTGSAFYSAVDTSATRFEVRSNGGIANFSANNVNLSDARTKTIDGPVESLRARLTSIPLYRGRYKDATRETADVMWTAQDIAAIAPEWTEVFQGEERDGNGRVTRDELMGTRDHQIFMANVAVTIEHDALIETLRAEIAALRAQIAQAQR